MGDWQPWNLDNLNSDNSNFPLTRTNFPFLDKNITEIYPDNLDSLLTRTVIRFPSDFELPGFFCSNNNNNNNNNSDDDYYYYYMGNKR